MRISDWSSDVCSSDLDGASILVGVLTLVLIVIWIGDAQRCKGFHLQRLHRRGGRIVDMILADEMERTVDDQVRCMISQRNALLRRLARAGFARQPEIAEPYLSPPGFFGVTVTNGIESCRERVCQS